MQHIVIFTGLPEELTEIVTTEAPVLGGYGALAVFKEDLVSLSQETLSELDAYITTIVRVS